MKKNILSLVAFMAFSVGAYANTIEIKEEEKPELSFVLNQINCDSVKYNIYWSWVASGASHDFAIGKANEAKTSCEEENKKNSEKKKEGIYAF